MKVTRWITACCVGLAASHVCADNGYPPPTGPYSAPPATPAQQGTWQSAPQPPSDALPQGGGYGYQQPQGGYYDQPPTYGYGEPYYGQARLTRAQRDSTRPA
ncbi:hypothetical protein [Solemya velesiana gill symbiont]|uniref:hypothetical protein n=1 Tax=Solemya velesiana gill symbiont TaxID=1918948 RepID=UPI000997B1FB|nr:hypothetical protein [Solemya velesiana gill symbiont]